jgi:hypothetical protein
VSCRGKSVATVRCLEGIELFPTLNEDGTHQFDASEVEALAARLDRFSRAQSAWLRAELARRAEEEAEDREHVARLAEQRRESVKPAKAADAATRRRGDHSASGEGVL